MKLPKLINPLEETLTSDEIIRHGSFTVQLLKTMPDRWFWRDKVPGCKPSIWHGPYPTRYSAARASGLPQEFWKDPE